MKNETPKQLVRTLEIRSLFAGDPFIEPAQEINDLIARRAHELFESSGFTHGHADDDWLRAESEILPGPGGRHRDGNRIHHPC